MVRIYLARFQRTLTFASNSSSTYGSIDFRDHWYWGSDPSDTSAV